jgi:quercetin dioxygenase-like cupin family protein
MAEPLVHIEDGETITAREQRDVVLLAERPDITITWSRYAPGERGPDLHVHREHTDAFYVLEGELTFALGPGAERVAVAAGGFVAVPPNIAHTFANESGADARWLNFHTPDQGFAAYMRGLRDGADVAFDSYDPPAGGGLPPAGAIVSPAGEGERLTSRNRVALLKGALADICLAEWDVDGPYDGPDPHDHDDKVDSFFVLDGELDVTVERSLHAVGPGTLACVPRGVRHTFGHSGDGRARFLNIHAPDRGFAGFLRGLSR